MTMYDIRCPVQIIECGKRCLRKITELRNIIYEVRIRIAPGKELVIVDKIIDNSIFLIFHDSYIILFPVRTKIHIKRTSVLHLFLKLLRNTFISWKNYLNIQI